MLLTVTVPAYNVEKYIGQCLESFVLPERAGQFEVLVINDGSTDGTEAAALGYQRSYPDIFRVMTKENGGHGSGINTGIANARGKYFRVVDGDDCIDTEAFEKFLDLLSHTDADLVTTGFYCCDAVTMEKHELHSPVVSGKYGEGIYRFDDICGDLLVRMHSITYRTLMLREGGVKIDEHSFYVDMEYNMFPVPYIETVCLSDLAVYKYRLGLDGQSVSVAGMKAHAGQHERVIMRCLDFLTEVSDGISPQKKGYIEKLCAEMTAMQHLVFLRYPVRDKKKAEAMRFDRMLKERCPGVYAANSNAAVALLRASGYLLYPAAQAAVRLLKR